jgi:hypothetical protein
MAKAIGEGLTNSGTTKQLHNEIEHWS